MDDIERIKAYHNSSSFLTEAAKEQLKRELGLTSLGELLDKRISGFTAEDELILILYFLECCSNLVPLEQGVNRILSGNIAPDFLISFKSGNPSPCFAEAKSTIEGVFKISKKDFETRLQFCASFNLPLIFFVRLNGIWGLFTSDDMNKRERKIQASNFIPNLFNEITSNRLIVFPPKINIESIYGKQEGIGISNSDYGNLLSWTLSFGETKIVVSREDTTYLIYSLLCEPIHDFLASKRNIEYRDGTTIINETLQSFLIIPMYQFFLSVVRHTLNETMEKSHTASSFLKQMVSGEKSVPVTKDLVYAVLEDMQKKGIPIFYAK